MLKKLRNKVYLNYNSILILDLFRALILLLKWYFYKQKKYQKGSLIFFVEIKI